MLYSLLFYFQFWLTSTAVYAEEETGVIDGTALTGRKGEREKQARFVHAVFLTALCRPEL